MPGTRPLVLRTLLALALTVVACSTDQRPGATGYPAASSAPRSQRGWEQFQTEADPDAPLDEAQGGFTARRTPITRREDVCFPAETRNVFSDVDMVPSGGNGALEPFDYRDADGRISSAGRNAIRGQNTWMLWGEGNEAFWNWLQQDGYGLIDFLVLLDSRTRKTRFRRTGMINQPGMKTNSSQFLGLYLDAADDDAVRMTQPSSDIDGETGSLTVRPAPPSGGQHPTQLFKPGPDVATRYEELLARLPNDGVDTSIYGYPSGVVGLRLFPNPDFFGDTDAALRARGYWKARVENTEDAYYGCIEGSGEASGGASEKRCDEKGIERSYEIQADPALVRPLRVSMTCGFCHVGPHPLNPPIDTEAPTWANLSSTIGNQYWSPPAIFANLTRTDGFLHHFLASQQPGTIDTSLVSTDHINNSNTINAIFDVPARLSRAMRNRPEEQSPASLQLRSLEDALPGANPRHTPRVLLDGADSVGVFGALARVYLNIGTFPEQWARCHNAIIGFKPQRPFAIATLREKSAYWRAAELEGGLRDRILYLAEFFSHNSARNAKTGQDGQSITAPMKLRDAPGGAAWIDEGKAAQGRQVFLDNCAICHSSKQPGDPRGGEAVSVDDGFQLEFDEGWSDAPAPAPGAPPHFTLPMRFEQWEDFRKSPQFAEYGRRIREMAAAEGDAFFENNFLSNEVRIPITLAGTNSGRAVATNGMRGQVWDNFSSETYKLLKAVGPVRFYNPYRSGVDQWGNNDAYHPPGGGPGYYRPASLISLWATAPYLHNNALGLYNRDPSVAGRLAAFEDGIDKLLDSNRRKPGAGSHPGDLRVKHADIAARDPGFIYRTTEETWIRFAKPFIRPLLTGILGPAWTSVITVHLWIFLAVLAGVLAVLAQPRHAGFTIFLVALISGVVVALTRLDRFNGWLWLVPAALTLLALWFWLGAGRTAARLLFAVALVLVLLTGVTVNRFVDGRVTDLRLGPIPMGTPVNLVMNLNPEAPPAALLEAAAAMLRGFLLVQSRGVEGADAIRTFEAEAGPALLKASKCPDFVLDRGHWFAESLGRDEKDQLKAFLKTL